MRNSEKAVMVLFNLGALVGFGSIFYGVVEKDSAVQLTPNITASFLMSICGNCTRILAKSEALKTEKLSISAAVLSYSAALFCDFNENPVFAVYLKLITTGCVGLWNAVQMIRLHPEIISCIRVRLLQSSQSQIEIDSASKVVLASFSCYCFGAFFGFGAMSIGLHMGVPPEKLGSYITLAFFNVTLRESSSHRV